MSHTLSFAVDNASPGVGLPAEPPITGGASVSEQPWRAPRLLWVDDSRMLLSLYKAVFESLGFEVSATSSPGEALERLSDHSADVAILDYDMPEMDGGMLASLMKDRYPTLPVILYSGNNSIPTSARHWVDAVCAKASPREELLATIDRVSHPNWQDTSQQSRRSLALSSSH